MNRRSLLKAAGGASALAGLSTTASADHGRGHELAINAPNDRLYPYQFAVTGDLKRHERARAAPIDPEHVTIDAEDDLDGCKVNGFVRGGWDVFSYTGKLAAFRVPWKWADYYDIYLDGKQVHAEQLYTNKTPEDVSCGPKKPAKPADDGDNNECGCQPKFFPSKLHVSCSNPKAVFKFRVTGAIRLPDGRVVRSVRGPVGQLSGGGRKTAVELRFRGNVETLDLSNDDFTVSLKQSV